MKKNCLALFCILLIAQLQAQTNYNINDYKYRVNLYARKTWTFSTYSENRIYQNDYRYKDIPAFNSSLTQTAFNHNLTGGYDQYRFINTENKQRIVSTTSYMYVSQNSSAHYSSARRNSYTRDRSAYLGVNHSIMQRNYKGSKFTMYSVDLNGWLNGGKFRESNNAIFQRSENNSEQIWINTQFGFGNGRLELISDPAFASFWLQDMKDKNVVENYSAEDIENLAKTITNVRNTRIIDFRFRTIDQIKMYDSFFRSSGLIKTLDAGYYSTLYDHYLYANNFSRYSGKRTTWFARISPYGLAQKSLTINNSYRFENNYFNSNLQTGIGVIREDERAVSLHRQRIRGSELFIFNTLFYSGYKMITTDSVKSESSDASFDNGSGISAAYTIGYGYYLNSRNYFTTNTKIGLTAGYDYRKYFGVSPNVDFISEYFHWFSPNLQLTVQAKLKFVPEFFYHGNGPFSYIRYSEFLSPGINIRLNYTIF